MTDYNGFDVAALVEMLASHTETYTKMLTDGYSSGDDISQLQNKLLEMQESIRIKQQEFQNNITVS